MTTNRKVRKDFDATKQYNVNVSKCSKGMKERVQQAFFDVGFLWGNSGAEYRHHDAEQYSNATCFGEVIPYCMYGSSTLCCNMSAQEFLDKVYEKGHIHAELMAQYAEDAKTTDKPWELYQIKTVQNIWKDIGCQFIFDSNCIYRRKPKTRLIHGVGIPVFDFTPKVGEKYYTADVFSTTLFEQWHKTAENNPMTQRMMERGLIYPYTEEGKQAAILH